MNQAKQARDKSKKAAYNRERRAKEAADGITRLPNFGIPVVPGVGHPAPPHYNQRNAPMGSGFQVRYPRLPPPPSQEEIQRLARIDLETKIKD